MERGQAGIGLVELMVALAVFAFLAFAAASLFGAALRTYAASRMRTVAEQVGTGCIEDIRSTPYDDVGLVGGNPPGTLPPQSTATRNGRTFTIARSVSFVNDPLPGGYVSFANYKTAVCSVSVAGASRPTVTFNTTVAPPTAASRYRGVIRVRVIDFALNAPVQGALVRILNGPDSPRSDLTPADGTIPFADLTPNPTVGPQSHYEIEVQISGYQTLREDLPPSPSARVQLNPSQVFETVIRVYRPSTINVRIEDQSGNLWTPATTVSASSSRGAEAFVATGGTLQITSIAGESVVPSVQYTVAANGGVSEFTPSATGVVPDNYPTINSRTFVLRMQVVSATGTLQVIVRDAITRLPLGNMDVTATGGSGNYMVVGKTTPAGTWTTRLPTGTYTIAVLPGNGYSGAQTTVAVTIFGGVPITIDVPRES